MKINYKNYKRSEGYEKQRRDYLCLSSSGILYGLAKVSKPFIDRYSSL